MKLRLFGHRGAGKTDVIYRDSGVILNKPSENTLESFDLAIKSNVNGIEFDVMQTADKQLVVIHSNNLDEHVFNQSYKLGHVSDYDLLELKTLPVGHHKNSTIPSLKEVLELIEQYPEIIINVEVKDVKFSGYKNKYTKEQHESFLDSLLSEIQEADLVNELIISSFSVFDIEYVNNHYPEIKTAMIFGTDKGIDDVIYNFSDDKVHNFTIDNITNVINKTKIDYFHPEIGSLDSDAIELTKKLGIPVNFWSTDINFTPSNNLGIEIFNQPDYDFGFIIDNLI